jgi:alpha-L-arabinofuranosidase
MRIFKYLFGIWIAIAVYTISSFFDGPKGLSAYNFLNSEQKQQWTNIAELVNINEELKKEKNNLLFTKETFLVHAHQIGYGYEDEHFIRIVGLGNLNTPPSEAGKVYITQTPETISDKNLKIAAVCAGFFVFIFLFVFEFLESKI